MNKNKLVLILIGILYLQNISAQLLQNNDSILFIKRVEAEQNICLLKNKNKIIPVKELDKRKIACISFGNDSNNIFQNRLSDYDQITHFNLKMTENEDYYNQIKHELKSFDLVICSFHKLVDNERQSYGLTKQAGEMAGYLSDSLPSILVLFGNAKALNEFNRIEENLAIVVAENNSADSQDLTAQLIFGGISAKGKLNVDINQIYAKGFGLESEGGIRFKYTYPEELGINGTSLNKKIDSIAENGIRMKAFPGCQILAAKNGKIFFYKTYGYHTFDSIVPVSKADLYDLASLTKVTAALPALMKLYDEGKIDPDAKISEYWPAFKRSNKKNITLKEALTHQAGLLAWIPFWKHTFKKNGKFKYHTFNADSSKNYPVKIVDHLYLHKNYSKKIYKTIKKSKLNEKKEYVYSDLSFHLYPKMVSDISGTNYEAFIATNFYKPLGASTICYNPMRKFTKDMIVPTEVDTFFRKTLIHGTVHDEGAAMLAGVSGNAGLFSSTLDLAKMFQMYLNMGKYGGEQLISETTMKEFTKRQFPENNNRRALGFDKTLLENKELGSSALSASDNSFGHTGFTGTLCWADPDNGLLYIFMSNRIYPTRNNLQLFELNIRPSIHQLFYDFIAHSKK